MTWLRHIPLKVRSFLLLQPLPDAWLSALRHQHELENPEFLSDARGTKPQEEVRECKPFEFKWNRSWDNIVLLIIMFLSAVILYLIMR